MKKLDKEMLQKNRFWIGLGGFGLVWFIALIVLLCSGDDTGAAKVDLAKKTINGINQPKNPKFFVPLDQKFGVLNGQKDRVWAQAWESQKEMMQWPVPGQGEGDQEYWKRLSTEAPFGEKLKETELSGFLTLYKPLLGPEEIAQYIDTSVVEVKSGAIKKDPLTKTPTSEECWFAMEDVTVQRELLSVVRSALDAVGNFDNLAFFRPVPPPEEKAPEPAKPGAPPVPPAGPAVPPATGTEEPAKKIVVRRSFRNARWQLDLVLERDEKKVVTLTTNTKLTNITSDLPSKEDPENAGLTFQLVQENAPKDSKPAEFTLSGAGKSLSLQKPVTLTAVSITDPQPTPNLYVRLKDDSTPEKKLQRMRSANWELELVQERLTIRVKEKGVEKDAPVWCVSPATKIKNVNYPRRTLPVALAVLAVGHPNQGWYPIAFPSDPLPWMGTTTLKTPIPVTSLAGLNEPVMVHQLFNPVTSPVKSIDDIVINANSPNYDATSHRTKNRPLMKASKKFEEAKPGEPPAAAAAVPGGGAMGAVPGGGAMGGAAGGMAMPGGKGGAAPATGVDVTPENGLPRNRYAMVTDQVRLMPVAMKLTVDQAYVQDVLTAVANSRLRIEVTQVPEQRARGITLTTGAAKPPEGGPPVVAGGMVGGGNPVMGEPSAGGGGMIPGGRGPGGRGPGSGGKGISGGGSFGPPSPGVPGFGGPSGYGGVPGGFGGGFGTGLPGGAANAGDEEDPNLVTIVIYGIATLYERYKAPTAAGAGGANPVKP